MPPDDSDQKRAYKFPFISAQLIGCEVPELIERILNEESLINMLFEPLNTEQELNLTLAGYMSKAFTALLNSNHYDVLSYLYELHNYGTLILDHLYSRSISDFVEKLLSIEEHGCTNFVAELIRSIETLVDYIDSAKEPKVISNASNILSNLLSRPSEVATWGMILSSLTSEDILEKLFQKLFDENTYVVRSACNVLLAIIANGEFRYKFGDEESTIIDEEDPPLVTLFLKYFDQIQNKLKYAKVSVLPTTFGMEIKTLGEDRLRLIEILTSIARLPFSSIVKAYVDSDVMEIVTVIFTAETLHRIPLELNAPQMLR